MRTRPNALVKTSILAVALVTVGVVAQPSGAAAPASSWINAGGGAVTDSSGTVWAADSGFVGGWGYSSTHAIAGTTAPKLFQSERAGLTGYKVPVGASGTYTVTLNFAELYWSSAGQRVFSVTAEGKSILTNLDIFAAAGPYRALTKTVNVPITDGTLNLGFTATHDTPEITSLSVVPVTPAPAATTAAPTASPSPAATTSAACTKTIAPTANFGSAVNALSPGDVACLQTGNYGARGTRTNWTVSGTSAANITVQAAPGATPTLLGFHDISGSYWVANHLLFDGPTGVVNSANSPSGEEVLVWAQGNNITIKYSEVRKGLWHAGIYSSGNNVSIIASYIHDIGPWSNPAQVQTGGNANNIDHGIYVGGGNNGRIINNVVEHNLAYGIQLWDANPTGWVIANNTVVRNGYGTNGGGIILWDAVSNTNIFNNIIANNGGYSISDHGTTSVSSGNTIHNNLAYNNPNGNFNDGGSASYSSNMVSNPLFVSGTTSDYRLQSGSAAIAAGTTVGAPTTDITGATRPQGVAPDMGAYKY